MVENIKLCMYLIDNVLEVMKFLNVILVVELIRGGIDGVILSYMGFLCLNLGIGGYVFYGEFEYIIVEGMDICINIIIEILKRYVY